MKALPEGSKPTDRAESLSLSVAWGPPRIGVILLHSTENSWYHAEASPYCGCGSALVKRESGKRSLVAIQEKNGATSIAASHIQLWLASGWGGRSRRLSRG